MKRIVITFLLLSMIGACVADEKPEIEITPDVDDCVNGWVSMDVIVNIDDEVFHFDPSCKFSFNEDFKTKNGLECKINAGMCTSFSPKNQIEVICLNFNTVTVSVKCP